MKKVNVEATKLNNEDVIATSGAEHVGKYHIQVFQKGAGTATEKCYLYPSDVLDRFTMITGSLPAGLTNSGLTVYSGNYWQVDLGDPEVFDNFYWNGTKWVKCNETHSS